MSRDGIDLGPQFSMGAPGYWRNEASGALQPVVVAYLEGRTLDAQQVSIMRAYLRQWMAAPAWRGPGVETLRARIDGISDMDALEDWLECAVYEGIDPF